MKVKKQQSSGKKGQPGAVLARASDAHIPIGFSIVLESIGERPSSGLL
jgi:hypothetical protein